jgi:hypothetical protein
MKFFKPGKYIGNWKYDGCLKVLLQQAMDWPVGVNTLLVELSVSKSITCKF